jgi:hypothetical protein
LEVIVTLLGDLLLGRALTSRELSEIGAALGSEAGS